ncbi:uncharacterized protein LOC113232343, partial [Hyposmocoma kahamanoa]|uniref:uncharacterized protein LOC113232343 n=1 Tax=Hyposmocoma kahamanoa TaxID=1477025 RepID=UPI000E6D9475
MTLRQLAADERDKYPEASRVTETAFYMDDLLYGADDIEEGKKLITDLNSLMNSGGFNLRKWASNDPRLLEDIKSTRNKSKDNVYNFKTENTTKTLGLCWNSAEDKFTFQCNIPRQSSPITKRSLLSEISRLFDPLGWLAPLSTKLKLLFQKLWKNDLKWDDEVSSDISKEWIKIKAELDIIKQYEILSWLMCRKNDVIELHGFCDASIEAYGCVVYVKVKNQPKTTLLAAKTKLVPHKKAITLPKLELCGAHLLSKLMKKIIEAFSQHNIEIYGWTDSMVVLGWLQGEPSRWKPFVANRVQKTIDVMTSTCWRYVKSNENPADAASRGLYALQLKENSLWWQGPTWLSSAEIKHKQLETYTTKLEAKKQCNVGQKQENKLIDNLLYKYSSFNKVTRVVAWLLRTFAPTRKQMPRYLTLQELSAAKLQIIRYIQRSEFATEMEQLRNEHKVGVKSKLFNLNPTIDTCGVLRAGGRLENANLSMEMKHSKIIPRDSRLAELLIKEAHELTFHGGARLTMANLRQQYWIPGGNNQVKKQLRNCVTCRKNNPTKQHQLMGDLPPARVEPALPFYHTGVDYTGFIDIKANKMRNSRTIKGYVALFICMVTKAIHLELVTDLTSSAFLAALKRMAARRGAPRHLYSDCGTNFVGTYRVLQEEYEKLRETFDEHFLGILAGMNIEWHFNAPSWPSAGGLWERAVRSLKFHLRRVVGEQRLTFVEFSTILAQLEACLNSRPLCALTEDIEDLKFLTPAHFLTGRAEVTVIETVEDARTRCSMEEHNKCNMITPQLRHEYIELQYYNQLLLTQHFSGHSRQRRGLINGVGYIANSLFGVLDDRFAE